MVLSFYLLFSKHSLLIFTKGANVVVPNCTCTQKHSWQQSKVIAWLRKCQGFNWIELPLSLCLAFMWRSHHTYDGGVSPFLRECFQLLPLCFKVKGCTLLALICFHFPFYLMTMDSKSQESSTIKKLKSL